jgi:hypothetical protein
MDAQPLSVVYEKLDSDARKRLSAMMSDIIRGKRTDIRTPFLKDLDDHTILDKFYDDVFAKLKSELNETLLEIEMSQKDKFGSRSYQANWKDRKPELLAGFNIPDKVYPYESHEILNGSGFLRPTSIQVSLDSMKRTTNSGLPELVPKRIIIDRGNYEDDGEDWPCVMFTRTQEQKKTRTVWGYPFNKLAFEGLYFLPVFNELRKVKYFSAYGGPDVVDEAISRLLYHRTKDEIIYSEDFSSFDQTIPIELIMIAFSIVESYYQAHYYEDIFLIANVFANIPLATPDGIWIGQHGIPSGSWFTSIIGSLIHLCCQYMVKETLQDSKNQVMGDDGVIVLPKSISLKDLTDVYSKMNLKLNETKTFESDKQVIYLQRFYCDDYKVNGVHRGVYPIYRALNRLIHMERFTNISDDMIGADYFSIRAIAILENCKWHPMHRQFVEWVAKNDKFNLEFSHSGLVSYIRNYQEKSVTTIQNQYSDNLTGIEDFETVKILKSL